MRLLVTGFGPFPRMPRNPSAAMAREVAAAPRLRLHGIEAAPLVLTTAYGSLPAELDPALAAGPDILLLLGVAGRASRVRVEERSTPRRSTLFSDARGARPELGAGLGAAPRRTRVRITPVLRSLARHRIEARRSRDAGRYLCNAAYFRALARTGPTLFVHIPLVPKPRRAGRRGRLAGASWRRALAAALVEIVIGMGPAARRFVVSAAIR